MATQCNSNLRSLPATFILLSLCLGIAVGQGNVGVSTSVNSTEEVVQNMNNTVPSGKMEESGSIASTTTSKVLSASPSTISSTMATDSQMSNRNLSDDKVPTEATKMPLPSSTVSTSIASTTETTQKSVKVDVTVLDSKEPTESTKAPTSSTTVTMSTLSTTQSSPSNRKVESSTAENTVTTESTKLPTSSSTVLSSTPSTSKSLPDSKTNVSASPVIEIVTEPTKSELPSSTLSSTTSMQASSTISSSLAMTTTTTAASTVKSTLSSTDMMPASSSSASEMPSSTTSTAMPSPLPSSTTESSPDLLTQDKDNTTSSTTKSTEAQIGHTETTTIASTEIPTKPSPSSTTVTAIVEATTNATGEIPVVPEIDKKTPVMVKSTTRPSIPTRKEDGAKASTTKPSFQTTPKAQATPRVQKRTTIRPTPPYQKSETTPRSSVTTRMTKPFTPLVPVFVTTQAMVTPLPPVVTTQAMVTPLPPVVTTQAMVTPLPPVETTASATLMPPQQTTAVPTQPEARTTARLKTTTRKTQPQSPRVVQTTIPTSPTIPVVPTKPPIKTTVAPEIPKDVTYSIRFEGNCDIVLNDNDVREKFEREMKNMFVNHLGVPQDNILLHDISCGSVDVLATLAGIQQTKVERKLDDLISSQSPLVVNSDGESHAFMPIGYAISDPNGTPTEAPARQRTPSSSELSSVDIIIIIVVSIIGGMLMIVIIVLIVHECRRRSHTKSFDLRGTPRPYMYTEDFTLTKMERGPAEYNDYGLVVNSTSNGHTRKPQVGVATIVEAPNQNGDTACNGYAKASKEDYEPELDIGPDSPSMSLMKSMREHDFGGGIENPSYSSEDILDSGTETDREMVSSDKGVDSPDHAPSHDEQMEESDSGRQSDSLMELASTTPVESPVYTPPQESPPNTPIQESPEFTPLQESPRSDLSNNTNSDLTYEPHEVTIPTETPSSLSHEELLLPVEEMDYPKETPISPSHEELLMPTELMDYPKETLSSPSHVELLIPAEEMDYPKETPSSSAHEELLMPAEEMNYPKDETEASVPETPPILSHSPESNTYEMTEKNRAGKRESDFFAPAEGATAF